MRIIDRLKAYYAKLTDCYTYEQSTGRFYSSDGEIKFLMYSGADECKNDPDAECIPFAGPIPRGLWEIGEPVNHPRLGPLAFPLTPVGHDALGRDDFWIHGPSKANPGDSSKGCIIASRDKRETIKQRKTKFINVVR